MKRVMFSHAGASFFKWTINKISEFVQKIKYAFEEHSLNAFLVLAIIFWQVSCFYAQVYERTGKNLGVYVSSQPISHWKTKSSDLLTQSVGGSIGFIHMVYPGIYPSIGYTFNQMLDSRNALTVTKPQNHMLDASLIVNKRIAKLFKTRIHNTCHYLSLGFIIAPEYHYLIWREDQPNNSRGEVSGQVGLSLYHYYSSLSKKAKSKTIQYDFFFRNGFTPILSTKINGIQQDYYRREFGVRIRFVKHQVYNFLPN